MNILDLIKRTRSIRRFQENVTVSEQTLQKIVECARFGASARNQQSLRYVLVNARAENDKLFPLLRWAGFIDNWDGPEQGKRPAAYIIVLHDNQIANNHFCDEGIAMQNMLLAANELGLGGCIIASVDKNSLRDLCGIPDRYDILDVVALGKPAEKIVLEDMKNDDYEYWRDDNDIHHVPKRLLKDIILKF